MAPHITVELFKPPETFAVACQGISFKHGNGGFNMHPPQFLVPFKLLLRIALTVHEIEYPTVFLVPAICYHIKGNLYRLVYQGPVIQAHTEVHQEPHCFKVMAGIDDPAFKTVNKAAVQR